MIKIHAFKQWTFRIPDGTDCDCDTLEEILYLATHFLQDGEKATITKNDHRRWLDGRKTIEAFNKKQANESAVSEPIPHGAGAGAHSGNGGLHAKAEADERDAKKDLYESRNR